MERDPMKWIAIIIVMLCLSGRADYYIRAGAEGTQSGADWTNAYTNTPATFTRGETYWVADGDYGNGTMRALQATAGTNTVTLKKARVGDHGTDAGWSDTYAQTQALFDMVQISLSNFTWDGNGRTDYRNGHGFRLYNDVGDGKNLVSFKHPNGTEHYTNIVFKDIEFSGDTNYVYKTCAIYGYYLHEAQLIGCYAHHCHRDGVFQVFSSVDVLYDHCLAESNHITAQDHGEPIDAPQVTNMTVRYCQFKDNEGTGSIVNRDGYSRNWYVFGNTFWREDVSGVLGDGSETANSSGMWFFNNTVVQCGNGNAGVVFRGTSSGVVVTNNIWFSNDWMTVPADRSYNYYSACTFPLAFTGIATETPVHEVAGVGQVTDISSDPFINSATGDFRLISQIADYPGIAMSTDLANYPNIWPLSTPGIDALGNSRGEGGVWDRGAYEYVPPASPSSAPHLRVGSWVKGGP